MKPSHEILIRCDLCGAENPRFVLSSPSLDGPLVQCTQCGFQYVGYRRSKLTFGSEAAGVTAERVRQANSHLPILRLEEERRLSLLNAAWRLDLIKQFKPSGRLLEVGCARGDFLRVARESFEVFGVEPNPNLADSAANVASIHRDVVENVPWSGFDVVASFHVIEHADSPRRFVSAMAKRLKPGGLMVLETPDIGTLPFRILRKRWRQFIPEHYFFFDSRRMTKLLEDEGLKVEKVMRIGKYASLDFVLNRLSRYVPPLKRVKSASSMTFRINPLDIMLVFATVSQDPRQ
jgi:2-polyprenyl-3-methyl-5-hydroxy-6-metoxy-1,4-benzoquinol methylase